MPSDILNDIVSAKKLLNELDCGPTDFLNKMHMNYIEGLTDAEQMLFDHIRRVVPYLRMYSSTIREIMYQSTVPARIPKMRHITKQRQIDGVIKRGRMVSYPAQAMVDGRPVTKSCTRIECLDCKKQFNSMDNFMQHKSCNSERATDDYVPNRKCPKCQDPDVDLSWKTSYITHTKHCNGDGTLSSRRARKKRKCASYSRRCEKCGRNSVVFTDHETYTQHIRQCSASAGEDDVAQADGHIYQVKFTCDICGDRITNEHNLNQHLQKHERQEHVAEQQHQQTPELVRCEMCEAEMFKYNLTEHMKIHRRVVRGVDLKCPICGRMMNMSNLKLHLSKKSGLCSAKSHNFTCKKCCVQCDHVDGFIAHFPCPAVADSQCSSNAATPSGTGVQSTSCGRNLWQCTICKYGFNSKQAVQSHMRNIHVDPDNSGCTACGARYYSTGADVEHQHRCRAPRPCRHCWEMLHSHKDLVSHVAVCRYLTQCMACLKAFESRSRLLSHVECAHPAMSLSCERCGFMCVTETAKNLHLGRCVEVVKPAETGAIQGNGNLRGTATRAERHRAIANRKVGSCTSLMQCVKPQRSVPTSQATIQRAGQQRSATASLSATSHMMGTTASGTSGSGTTASGTSGSVRPGSVPTSQATIQPAGQQRSATASPSATSHIVGTTASCTSESVRPGVQIQRSCKQGSRSSSVTSGQVSRQQASIADLFPRLPLYQAMCSPNASDVNPNANFDWSGATERIARMQRADVLIAYLNRLHREIPPLVMSFSPEGLPHDRLDEISEKFLSTEIRDQFYPVHIAGDGNCMPRAISRLIFGTQERFEEVRIRIAIEAALQERRYTSEWMITRGLESDVKIHGSSVVRYYMRLTPTCIAAEELGLVHFDEQTMSTLFRQDLVRWAKEKVWLSMWQLHMASNVCGQTIRVVHPIPEKQHRDWHIYNRKIVPKNPGREQGSLQIMFTSTKENTLMPTLSEINHFVPLIRRT